MTKFFLILTISVFAIFSCQQNKTNVSNPDYSMNSNVIKPMAPLQPIDLTITFSDMVLAWSVNRDISGNLWSSGNQIGSMETTILVDWGGLHGM